MWNAILGPIIRSVILLLLSLSIVPLPCQADNRKFDVVLSTGHSVAAAAFSPDGQTIVTASGDRTLKIWNAASSRELRTLAGHVWGVWAVAYSPDGRMVASGSGDHTVKLWDPVSGQELRTLRGHTDGLRAVAFSPDGRSVASASDDSSVKIWDATSGRELRTLAGHTARVRAVSFSPDGRTIASASEDKTVKLWDLASGRVLRTIQHSAGVLSIEFSPDGSMVASRILSLKEDHDCSVTLWKPMSGEAMRTLHSSRCHGDGMAFLPDGRTILILENGDIGFWDVGTGQKLKTIGHKSFSDSFLAVSPNGRQVLALDSGGASLWDVETESRLALFKGRLYPSPVKLGYSPDGRTLVSGSSHLVEWWDTASAQRDQAVINSKVADVGFSADGRKIALSNEDTSLRILDAVSGKELKILFGPKGSVNVPGFEHSLNAVAFAPDSNHVVSGGNAGILTVWDVRTGLEQQSFSAHATDAASLDGRRLLGGVTAVSFSPNGRTFVSGGADNTLKLWDLLSGQCLQTLVGHSRVVRAVAFSPDGRRVVSASTDATIRLWDAASGRELRRLTGHSGYVNAVAFSPDGRTIVSGSADNTLRQWDAASGRQLRILTGHSGEVTSVAFSPDGRIIVSAGLDYTVRYWSARGELLATSTVGQESEWLTITPEGFFESSANYSKLISLVRGLEVYGIDQVYQSLYRPDLVREKLAGDPRGLVREAAARLDLEKVIGSGNAPEVRVTVPTRAVAAASSNVSAVAEIADRGGGIGRVEWRVNGVTAAIDNPNRSSPSQPQPQQLTRSFALDVGSNNIEVVAYNRVNLIASVPAHVSVDVAQPTATPGPGGAPVSSPAQAPVAAARPRLFVLVAGINQYADKRVQLAYAVSDAKDVARSFKEAAGDLYPSVDVKLMTDAEVSRDRLDAAFTEIAGKAKASDVFVFYLAGHGKTIDGRYYFVPQNFKIDGEFTDKTINASVVANGVSQDQLQQWFALIPARKSVILFDTCDSGTLTGDAGETQQLERAAANDRLAQATGRSIITASAGSQEALEGYHGHGLFTYEMLDAVGRGDGDNNGTVEVTELAAYVYAQVVELSQKVFKQRQAPQMRIAANFPLVKQTQVLEDEATPVAEAKPTYQVMQTAQLQIQPIQGATIVRSLSAKTAVTVLENNGAWALVASNAKPIGYVATRVLAPAQP